jgi:hypothetical protein
MDNTAKPIALFSLVLAHWPEYDGTMVVKRNSTERVDHRDEPAYPLSEASRYLKLAPATLRTWVAGRSYPTSRGARLSRPLIHPPSTAPSVLSFWNLIEAHVLPSLRTEHGVSLNAVRKALRYSETSLGITRLLLRKELLSDAGALLLGRYGELINLSASG